MPDRTITTVTTPATTLANPNIPLLETPLGLYEKYQGDLAPAWLQAPRGRAWNAASGKTKDQLVDTVTDAVQARFVQSAPDDALPLLAGDRLLERYPQETTPVFRARIAGAFDVWEFAGTVYGLKLVLEQAGWIASIVEHWRLNPSIWAEFSVFVTLKNPVSSLNWDEFVWDDGTNWDFTQTALEAQQLLRLIAKFKAGHSKLRELWVIQPSTANWDEFDWNDGTNWESSSSYRIYP